MSAIDLTQLLTHLLYLSIFAVTLAAAVRRPTRANVDVALFFGLIAFVILLQRAGPYLPFPPEMQSALLASVAAGLPYALLRLVGDFSDVPAAVMRAAEIVFAGLVVTGFALMPAPGAYLAVYGLYFLVFLLYASLKFVREARRSTGVTRRRLEAVSAGSVLLGLAVVAAVAGAFTPGVADTTLLTQFFALTSGIAYYIGFAPPRVLRRAWQEPELRAFLAGAARLPRLPDTLAIVRELERGAATSTGARAGVGLWQPTEGVLRFWNATGGASDVRPGQFIAGKAFAQRHAIFAPNAARDDPESADAYRQGRVFSILAAPIIVGERALGVLVLHSPRSPIFGDDDLALVQLLADQAAVILESRALIDEAARVRAHEEATRLKEDFLSAAAHDLRTPLTTIVTQAQLLERRAERDPQRPMELAGIRRLVGEARRLNALVVELLDASRAERGQLVSTRDRVDLCLLVREVAKSGGGGRHRVVVETDGRLEGEYDQGRVRQLVENLIENAVKYSPQGGEVRVRAWREAHEARIAVHDRGIGIHLEDLPHIFERFRRGRNVDDRHFAGMGLGLYICRAIAEQHGGRIWAESELGQGSTFHVALPVMEAQEAVGVGGHGRHTA